MTSHSRGIALFCAAALALLALAAPAAHAADVDLPRYPSISPDGAWIVFSWQGDLWLVPAAGGHAARMTNHPGTELRSAWSPDGAYIAFDSTRSGASNLYVMGADGSGVRQVTSQDAGCVLTGWSDGGRSLTFQASREGDVYREPRPYSVDIDSGRIERLHDAHGRSPRVSPDGSRMLFSRGGSSWTRRHYRGPANRDVWLHESSNGAFVRLTEWAGNDGLARWQDAGRVVYLSDRELDTVNVWRMSAGRGEQSAERLTGFEGYDVQYVDVATGAGVAVLHVWDRLYTLDLRTEGAEPVPLTITAAQDQGDATFLQSAASKATEAALSPDGKTLAIVAFGEIFVRGLEDSSPTRRVTANHAREQHIEWSPDGMRLYFVSDRDGTESIYAATVETTASEVKEAFETATKPPEPETTPPETPPETTPPEEPTEAEEEPGEAPTTADDDATKSDDEKETEDDGPDPKRWHDALRFTIEPVLVAESSDRAPLPSPDGKSLLFTRDGGDLCRLEIADGTVTVLSPGWDRSVHYRWSPDARHVAFSRNDRNFNADIWIVAADGSAPAVNVSRHPDNDFSPRWSADGRVMAFSSERYDEQLDVMFVFLDEDLEDLPRHELDAYFKKRAAAAKKTKPLSTKPPKDAKKTAEPEEPPALELETAWRRVRRVTSTNLNEAAAELTPAGDRIVYTNNGNLHAMRWDGKEDKKLRAAASVMQLSLSGDKVVYVAGGKPGLVNVAGGGDKTYPATFTIELERARFAEQKFREAAGLLGQLFYHPTMKGLDWPGVSQAYLELARRARTSEEFDHVANRLLGELNASHLGIRSPSTPVPVRIANGRLGVDLVPAEGGWVVSRVLPEGPAHRGAMRLAEGDLLTTFDGQPIADAGDPAELLRGRAGQDVLIDLRRSGADGEPLELRVLLRAISSGQDRELRYRAWVADNEARVDEWSAGRIGYIHIRAMSRGSLRSFERDLYAAATGRDGLLVDVRNNGGGHTADYVLASIMARPHAYTVPRGADPSMTTGYPQDRLFIQRTTTPMNMLCNEKSFSNAEIVSHAFKTLGRGTLVGEQTYGGVISTGMHRLLDGTSVRTPFRGWYLPDGTDMENNGAMPDLRVPQTPQAESRGDDEQLRAATTNLLERLDG